MFGGGAYYISGYVTELTARFTLADRHVINLAQRISIEKGAASTLADEQEALIVSIGLALRDHPSRAPPL